MVEKQMVSLDKMRETFLLIEEEFESKRSDTQSLLERSRGQYDHIKVLLDEKIRSLENERISLIEEAEALRDALKTASAERDAAREENRAAQASASAAIMDSEAAAAEAAETAQALKAALAEIDEMRIKVHTVLNDKAALEYDLTGMRGKMSDLKKQLADLLPINESLTFQIKSLQAEVETARSVVESVSEEKAELQMKLDQLQSQWQKIISGD